MPATTLVKSPGSSFSRRFVNPRHAWRGAGMAIARRSGKREVQSGRHHEPLTPATVASFGLTGERTTVRGGGRSAAVVGHGRPLGRLGLDWKQIAREDQRPCFKSPPDLVKRDYPIEFVLSDLVSSPLILGINQTLLLRFAVPNTLRLLRPRGPGASHWLLLPTLYSPSSLGY